MNPKRTFLIVVSLVFLLTFCCIAAVENAHPLPSWNDGSTKQSIIEFVETVTTEGSPDYVAPAQRIAVFDNDGTLWAEQPLYFEGFFTVDRVKTLAPGHPEWKEEEPFASLLTGNAREVLAGDVQSMQEILIATHSGMSTEEFEKLVNRWISTAKHPVTNRPFTQMVYQPMLELMAYLRASGFKTFIVSGGGSEFMRPWAEDVYGIPPEQVVGTTVKTKYEMCNNKPVLMRLPEFDFIDVNEGKPIGIQKFIGRVPLVAFGNSDGDLQMLQWTDAGPGKRLSAVIHHTDAEREWAYDDQSPIGHLEETLKTANAKGWTVVDMKRDWKFIFHKEENP